MPKKGQSVAQANKAVRQEALREWLSKKCTAQHLIDNLEKIEDLDPESEVFTNALSKYKVANEQRLKIMNKYLPDVRQVELSGADGDAIKLDTIWTIKVVE